MEDVLNHLNAFLDMKYSSISEFPEQCTLKFFSKDNIDYQNSILINKENKTIVDMKISDTGVFTKILEKFGQENIPKDRRYGFSPTNSSSNRKSKFDRFFDVC